MSPKIDLGWMFRRLIGIGSRGTDPGLHEVYPDDVYFCSYPRSGNIWVWFMLAHYLVP